MKKKCTKCLASLPLSRFRVSKGYPQNVCRSCEKRAQRERERPWNIYAWRLRRKHPGCKIKPREIRDLPNEACYLCGGRFEDDVQEPMELDHVLPVCQGGKTAIENLRWAHKRCNRMKGEHTPEQFLALLVGVTRHLRKFVSSAGR